MRHAPDAQHREFGSLLEANHDTTMAFDHCVFAIDRHGHELGMPDCRHIVQRIHETSYQDEIVFDSVPFEHWDGNQV